MSDRTIKLLFIVPTLFLLIAMNIFPLLWSLILSFSEYDALKQNVQGLNPRWIGIRNYTDVLRDKAIWKYFSLTAKYVIFTICVEFVVGFGLALLLHRPFKGKGLITTLILIPMMMSPPVIAMFWRLLYNPKWGIVNYMLGLKDFVWLTNPRMALASIVIANVWMWAPFTMLLSLAGLSAIPQYLYEAAEIDRASWWFKFRRITLPLVSPLLLLALLFRTMEAFKMFDLAFIMTAGGPGDTTELISINLYRIGFMQWNTGKASALGYIVLIMVIAISTLFINYLNRIKER